ncbi:sigma-70 family RNA polymerase sigma factor [Achromobacter spanius]|uniref:sigma-70 family RNA polymerase sigma factor n=1 Tax=Achromobacter spanius TaxID=217203 RepID=UPI003824EBDC
MSSLESLEHRALGMLYRDHHGWLRNWLQRRLSGPAEAADLTQDTFMRLLASPASMAQLQGVRQPRSFLATVAQRTLVDHIRRQVLERAWLETLAQQPEAHAISPETQALLLETIREIDAMLQGLGHKVRRAFLMSQLEGASYADIALQLGVTVSSVKKYMARATEHCLVYALDRQ